MSWIDSLKKNWRLRLSAFFIVAALIVLLDEIVKEGYTFDIADLLAWPPSHEQIFLLLLALAILLGLRVKRNS